MDGTTYGGGAWYQEFLNLLATLLSGQLQKGALTGTIVTPAVEQATEEEALDAIWANRPDLKEHYDEAWGEGEYNPRDAVRNWLYITDEDVGDRNPVTYAESKGWVAKPSEETREDTLEKKRLEHQQKMDEKSLEIQERSLELQERLGIGELELQEMLGTADLELRRESMMTNAEIERERNRISEELGLRRIELDELLGIKQLDLQYEQLAFQKFAYESDLDLANRQLELQAEVQRGNLDVSRELAAIERFRASSDADIAQQKVDLDRLLGEKSLALEEKALEQEYSLALQQMSSGELALGQRELDIMRMLGLGEQDIARAELALQERLGQGELGLGYLGLLSQLSGPRDWVKYANVQRAAQQTELPAWANMLAEGQAFAPFQGAQEVPPLGQYAAATPAIAAEEPNPMWTETLAEALGTTAPSVAQPAPGDLAAYGLTPEMVQTMDHITSLGPGEAAPQIYISPEQWQAYRNYKSGQPPGYAAPTPEAPPAGSTNLNQPLQSTQQANPYANLGYLQQPHQIRIDQWANMLPGEQQMLLGLVEAQGGYADDWLRRLYQSAPQGRVNPTSVWGGW